MSRLAHGPDDVETGGTAGTAKTVLSLLTRHSPGEIRRRKYWELGIQAEATQGSKSGEVVYEN